MQPGGIWDLVTFTGHDGGINGINWGPPTEPCLLLIERNDYQINQ